MTKPPPPCRLYAIPDDRLLDLINRIEASVPVANWAWSGISLWPVIRIKLFADNATLGNPPSTTGAAARPAKMVELAQRTWRLARGLVAASVPAPRTRHEADGVFLATGLSLYRLPDGRLADVLCDPLRMACEDIGRPCVGWTLKPSGPRLLPDRYLGGLVARSMLASRISRRNVELDPAMVRQLDAASCLVKNEGGEARALAPGWITAVASQLDQLSKRFLCDLFSVGARFGMVANYTSLEGMAFSRACRQAGIPCIDIQHGVQGRIHPAYCRWQSTPTGGYDLIPSRFWVWSAYERDVIDEWAAKAGCHHAWAGGNAAAWFWQSGRIPVPDVPKRIGTGERIEVLVSLQPGFLHHPLSTLLHRAMRLGGTGIRWWIRLHPCMLNEREHIARWLQGSADEWEIDGATALPLHVMLPHISSNLTAFSTVIIDAAACGVASVATEPLASACYPIQVQEGMLDIADSYADPQALINLLLASARRKRPPSPPTPPDMATFLSWAGVI